MKKFWIVLAAMGLIVAFSASASAVDVKFGGSYYVFGMYVDKPSMNKDQSTTTGAIGPQAFYGQRLRIETTFKVAEGLNLVTRFDALERRWGDARWMGTGDTYNRQQGQSLNGAAPAANTAVQTQENIEFERAYLDFTTKIGRFNIGYQNFVSWGTEFHETNLTRAGIKYFIPIGPLTVIAAIEKGQGGDSNVGTGTSSDADNNVYDLGAIYKFGAGDAGLIYQKGINKTIRPADSTFSATRNRYSDLNIFIPYAKLKFGPVYVEGEAIVGFGDARKFDSAAPAGTSDVSGQQYALYLHAKGDIGPAYVGARFVYISGDDPKTTDKVEGGFMTALLSGDAFNPCLIMWNDKYTKWVGNVGSTTPAALGSNPFTTTAGSMDTYMDNAWFYQVYGGFKPTPKIDIMASVSFAYADKKPYSGWTAAGAGTEFLSDQYGTEIDVTAKYKIFDNLEYMAGFAYFLTGDYFKGASTTFNKSDNYLLMHQLTLTF